MNTFFSVIILIAFISLFVFLMYKILGNTLSSSSPAAATGPPFNDEPTPAAAAELQKVRSTSGTSIVGISRNQGLQRMTLRDVIIKASSNTALTGSYVNLDMITQVLTRGCRFLDFQVFIKNHTAVVGYSSATYDPSFTSMTSLNCVSLAGVCSTIMANAFSDTSPNMGDPLFVQFHLQTAQSNMYDTIAQILYANFHEKMLMNNNKAVTVTPDTRISDLMGRIVILMDAPLLKTTAYVNSCNDGDITCQSLPNIVNMQTNTPTVPLYTEGELLKHMFSPSSANSYLFRIVQPSLGYFSITSNADAHGLIMNYGVQVVAESFYILDANLASYEQLFDGQKAAIASLSEVIGVIKKAKGTAT
jgi:hypothetical protein